MTGVAQVKGMSEGVTRPRGRRQGRAVILLMLGLVATLVNGGPASPVSAPTPAAAPAVPRPEAGASGSLRILTWNVLAPALWEGWMAALGWGETHGVRRARALLGIKSLRECPLKTVS